VNVWDSALGVDFFIKEDIKSKFGLSEFVQLGSADMQKGWDSALCPMPRHVGFCHQRYQV
jgi:hypothetical protein